jgi:hypothetical protein
MIKGSVKLGFAVALGVLLASAVRPASADVIDFEQFTGPTTFGAAGNAKTLNISTSIGTVTVSGGVILTNTSNLPADETSIYGTAGNAANIGVTTGTGFTNPIVITFPMPIANFSLDILNGNVQTVTYKLSDNLGNNSSFDIAPNTSGGAKTFGFASAGNVIDITATTGQSTPNGITWDFFIDNIHFSPLATVPEPSPLVLSASAAVIGLGLSWCRRKRSTPR